MRKALVLTAAGGAIAVGLMSVAATAYAAPFPPPRHQTPTTLSATESAPFIVGRERDTITGTLTAGYRPLAGESVTLEIVNGRGPLPIATERTDRRGDVSFTVAPRSTTTYELVFNGTRTLAASQSGTVTVHVRR